ncbi:hypothetical protein [Simplicispira psychrophila]|nr:hypothetical protein [Simplicispira psychrophila]
MTAQRRQPACVRSVALERMRQKLLRHMFPRVQRALITCGMESGA